VAAAADPAPGSPALCLWVHLRGVPPSRTQRQVPPPYARRCISGGVQPGRRWGPTGGRMHLRPSILGNSRPGPTCGRMHLRPWIAGPSRPGPDLGPYAPTAMDPGPLPAGRT
jgi:hypothetical protein